MIILWIVLGLGVLAIAGSLSFVLVRFAASLDTTSPRHSEPDLRSRIAALEIQVKALPSLWEEERERADRAAKRLAVAEARARERGERDAPDAPPQDVHGGNDVEERGLFPVPSDLDEIGRLRREHVLRQIGRVD